MAAETLSELLVARSSSSKGLETCSAQGQGPRSTKLNFDNPSPNTTKSNNGQGTQQWFLSAQGGFNKAPADFFPSQPKVSRQRNQTAESDSVAIENNTLDRGE